MFIRELLALYVYNYFEMINPTCSFSLPLSFGKLKYLHCYFLNSMGASGYSLKFLGEKLDSGFHIGALLSGEGLGPEKVVTNISENKSQSSRCCFSSN